MGSKYNKKSRLAIAGVVVKRALSDVVRPELGHNFGIIVQKSDLAALVFKSRSSYSMNNIREDVVIATTLQEKLANLDDETPASVLDLLENNVCDICIAGNYMFATCCKTNEFVISPDKESLDDLVDFGGLMFELIGACRVKAGTKIGFLMKECTCA